jgi:hypothetical protein
MGLKLVPLGVCLDSLKVLTILLGMAMEGKIRGLALIYRTSAGQEETLFTGVYERVPRNAVTAAASMLWTASSQMNQVSEQGR